MSATQEVTTPTPTPVLELTSRSMIDSMIEDVNKRIVLDRQLITNLRKLSKEIEKDQKKLIKHNKVKRSIKQNPQKVVDSMQDFIKKNFPDQVNDESMYTRRHLMKLLSEYIKSKNIQNQENKKQWSGKEKALKKLFKLDLEWYTFMSINGLLTRVIQK